MSITLRDAQHLCWKNFRMINDKLDPERGRLWTPSAMVSDFREQLDKVNTAVKDLEDPRLAQNPEMKEKLATGLSDLLYMIFILAEHYAIELEESFLQTVNDYMLKFVK